MITIEIALAANAPYFRGMLVTACSIAKSARADCRLSFNILDGGIADADYEFMVKRVRDYHVDSVFSRLPVNDEMFDGYPAWHGNKMAYARLILPSALKDKDWCIYCDVDFLWLRDICELWQEKDRPFPTSHTSHTSHTSQTSHTSHTSQTSHTSSPVFIGTADGNSDTLSREESWFAKKGYPFDRETYFCSGLCFFNLKAFREQKLIEQCAEILAANPDIQFPDQAALNIVTFGKSKIVSRCWQCFSYELNQGCVDNGGCVVHFAGEIPWRPLHGGLSVFGDALRLWHKINAEICGISEWRSVRKYNPLIGYIYHRTLFYLLRTPFVRQSIHLALILANKPGAWRMFERKSTRIRI